MSSIKTIGDFIRVLSVYSADLPFKFFSNGVGGQWPRSKNPMTCDVDECIASSTQEQEPEFLRIALFPTEHDYKVQQLAVQYGAGKPNDEDDTIDEALQDAGSDGEGRITPYYLRHHLDKRGLRIVPNAERAKELLDAAAHQRRALGEMPFVFDPAHVEAVKQALRVHGGTPPGLRQAAEYIERLEKRVKELEARS